MSFTHALNFVQECTGFRVGLFVQLKYPCFKCFKDVLFICYLENKFRNTPHPRFVLRSRHRGKGIKDHCAFTLLPKVLLFQNIL